MHTESSFKTLQGTWSFYLSSTDSVITGYISAQSQSFIHNKQFTTAIVYYSANNTKNY